MTRLMLILFLTGSAMNDDHHQRQNKEMITPAEGRLWQALKDMQWQSQLSEAERKQVIEGLLSPKEDIYGEAIIVVGVHRLREMLPVLEGVAGGRRELYDRMIEALKTPGDPVIFLRDVAPKLHGSPPGVVVRDVRFPREVATNLVVIAKARDLRAGKEDAIDIGALQLSDLNRKILASSRLSREKAVDELLKALSTAKIAGRMESEDVAVLETYGESVIPKILDRLERLIDDEHASKYAKGLLLRSLRPYLERLDGENAARLRAILTRLEESKDPWLANDAKLYRTLMKAP